MTKPVGAALSRDIDVAQIEQVEGALDAFIEGRHNKRVKEEGDLAEEEAWKETERRHAEQRRADIREAWCAHHAEQASRLRTTLESLIAHHEEQAQKLGG